MARPTVHNQDPTILWDLAFLGHSDQHIAEVIGCHQSLLSKRHDLAEILQRARNEAAVAMAKLWCTSSQGALRDEQRPQYLARLVADAQRRKIRRIPTSKNDRHP